MNHVVLSLTLAAMFAALILSHETLGCCLPYIAAVVATRFCLRQRKRLMIRIVRTARLTVV